MKTITVTYPNGDTIELRPVPISDLGIVSDRLEAIQGAWWDSNFSTGDALMMPGVWEAIKLISSMLPRVQDPSVKGFDVELLASDYEQLEGLFFGGGDFWNAATAAYLPEKFISSRVVWLHQFDPVVKLRAALRRQESSRENTSTDDSPQTMPPSPAAGTPSQTASPTSLLAAQKSLSGHGPTSTGKPLTNSSTA